MTEKITLGDYLASLPYQHGYHLNDHVVVIAMNDAGNPSFHAAVPWDVAPPPDEMAESIKDALAGPLELRDAPRVLIVGYGPEGADRAMRVRAAMTGATPDQAARQMVLIEATERQYRIFDPPSLASDTQPIPEVRPEVLLDGHRAPEASLADMEAQYAPLSEPQFTRPPAATIDTLESSPPSMRMDIATRYLDQLSAAPPHQITHVIYSPCWLM